MTLGLKSVKEVIKVNANNSLESSNNSTFESNK
ncbi:hypothetical protein BDCR2A_02035 [Borrelia duttonii CR2A]|uniref:Uncharacterized protein n=1 Tax=Borrelia duttonii CR2A TaxID=1432657 RepID=W6TIW7_9SPIR|nr:hypothetical protein BDCR2A_02035 [Borrelia duttonii CR2A]